MPMTNPGLTDLENWWALDEDSGNAIDSHGSEDLVETGGTIASTVDFGGVKSRDFEAATTHWFQAQNSSVAQIGNDSCTLGIWTKSESYIQYYTLMAKTVTAGNQKSHNLMSAGGGFIWSCSSTGSNDYQATGMPSIDTVAWHLIGVFHDAVNNLIGITYDGALVDTTAFASTGIYASSAPFTIGATANPAGYYDGRGALAFFYRKLFTSDEWSWMFNGGAGRVYSELGGTPASIPKVKSVNGILVANIASIMGLV